MLLKKSYPMLKNRNVEDCLNVKETSATSLGDYTLAVSKKDAIESFKSFYKYEEITLTCQTLAVHADNYLPSSTARLTKLMDHAGFLRIEFPTQLSNCRIWDTLSFRDGNNKSYTFMSSSWYCPIKGNPSKADIWNNEFYADSGYQTVSPCIVTLFVTF